MVRIFNVDGTETVAQNGFTFTDAAKIVDGPVEVIWLPDNEVLLVNEDGYMVRLPPNPKFSGPGARLVGNVILLQGRATIHRVLGGV